MVDTEELGMGRQTLPLAMEPNRGEIRRLLEGPCCALGKHSGRLIYWEGTVLCRVWLGNLDSNQDKQSQSLLCYRYTIPQ